MVANWVKSSRGRYKERMRLLLVRHGQTSWNDSGRAQGHTDILLDPTGLEQARLIGDSFSSGIVNRVLSSDLNRSLETARCIALASGIELEIRQDLRERCFGEWEGLPFSEVSKNLYERAQGLGTSQQEVRPPAGESFLDVWSRLDAVHDELRDSNDDIAIVSHGGALSLLLAKLLRGTLDTSRAFRFGNTGITELERRNDGLFLISRYNDTSHLASARVLSGGLDGISR